MLITFDAVVVIIMALIIIRAWFKGFSGMLLSVVSFIISAAAAWFLYPVLARTLDNGKLPYTVWCGIAMIIIYIVSLAVCTLLSLVVNMFFKLPVLKTANKALGLALGVVCALILSKIASKAILFIYDTANLGDAYQSIIVRIFN